MKYKNLILGCVIIAMLVLSTYESGPVYAPSERELAASEKRELAQSNNTDSIEAILRELDSVEDAEVEITKIDITGQSPRTVNVTVTPKADKSLTDAQYEGIVNLIDDCFGGSAAISVTITENK